MFWEQAQPPPNCVRRMEPHIMLVLPYAKKVILLILLFCLLFTPGCWDRIELEDLAYILAMGVDYLPDEELIEVTVSVIRPIGTSGGAQAGGGGEREAFNIITTKGVTLSSALEQLHTQLARRPYFAHNGAIIIGEKLARQGLHLILDRLTRVIDVRLTANIFVTDENVQHVFRANARLEEGLPLYLARWGQQASPGSLMPVVDIRRFVRDLLDGATDPFAPRLNTASQRPISPLEHEVAGEETSEKVVYPTISGTAVFQEDKLVGYLEQDETKGLLYVRGEISDDLEVIPDPFANPGYITFIFRNATASITPQMKASKPAVLVEVRVEGELC